MHKQPAAADRLSLSEVAQPEIIAAVDLGSNSFHMIVGELRHGQLAILDRIRETVRLAEGLSSKGDLSDDARERAISCLSLIGPITLICPGHFSSATRASGTSSSVSSVRPLMMAGASSLRFPANISTLAPVDSIW